MLQRIYFYEKEEDIKSAIEATNRLRTWFNENAEAIRKVALDGFKIANNTRLDKRTMSKIQLILDTTPFRAFLKVSEYSICLEADICWQSTGGIANYVKEYRYLEADKPVGTLHLLNLSNVLSLIKLYKDLFERLQALESEVNSLQYILQPFKWR